jgi:hypothetical protein
VCDPETSGIRRPWPTLGRSSIRGGGGNCIYIYYFLGMSPNVRAFSSQNDLYFIMLFFPVNKLFVFNIEGALKSECLAPRSKV